MEKLDLKDRKILYHLDIDCRQSFRSISKKIGLSKDIVSSRVNKLESNGIIKNYYTMIDSFKLGYIVPRFYLNFTNMSSIIKKEIIDHFVNIKEVGVVGETKGSYDLVVGYWVKEIDELYSTWKKTLDKYRDYFQSQIFSTYTRQYNYSPVFLLADNPEKIIKEKFEIVGGGKKQRIDEVDLKILSILSNNARIPTVEIAENLDISSLTVTNRINNLKKLGIIQAYRIDIDYSNLKYHFFKANINISNYSLRKDLLKYITKNPNLIMIDESIGFVDLELNFILPNIDSFHEIMDDLTIKFPNSIKNYSYFYISKFYKLSYTPDELFKE